MNQTIDIPLTEPQDRFVFSEAQFPALVAGLGAGKSRASTFRLIILMIEHFSIAGTGINTLYTMPTYDLLRLRAMTGVEDDLQMLGIDYRTNRSEYSIFIPELDGSIIFRSYDRPERLVAFEVAHSIADELDTLPKEKASFVFRKIVERTRQKTIRKNSIGVPTTPDQGVNGFVYQKWVKEAKEGYEIIKASTLSNPYLPKEYVEQIRSNYDPILAQLYLEGEFVSLNDSKVYHYFDRRDHHSDRVLTYQDKRVHVSIDFNVGGCCSVVSVIDGIQPVAVDEFTSHDTYDFVNQLNKRFSDREVIVYPDASGQARKTNASGSDVDIIRQAGFRVDVKNSNPMIRDRINAVNALLSHNTMKINTEKCPELTHAMETQGYDKKGDPEKWDDHPAIDDWVDSFGYFVAYKFPIKKPIASIPFRFAV